jgi:hypothetical protein
VVPAAAGVPAAGFTGTLMGLSFGSVIRSGVQRLFYYR